MAKGWRKYFWQGVHPTYDGCWERYIGPDKDGYSQMSHGKRAHRYVYELFKGPLRYCCLHRCDNKKCVNPAHLYDGTPASNTKDMYERGNPGGNKKIDPCQADEIRALRKMGATEYELAEHYGLCRAHINKIVNNLAHAV